MASVPLRFIPPADPGFVTLEIYEAPTKEGSFSLIESVAAGSYPNYIDHYTTDDAVSGTDWFAIRWVDDKGAVTEMSAPLQGGTETLVGIIVQRMLLRDSLLNENIAAQEAEAAISDYFGVTDPSTIDPSTVSPKILEGLTLLALSWSYTLNMSASSSVQKFTAGLVSLDSGSSSAVRSQSSIDALLKLANRLLGTNFSTILQMKELKVSSGYTQLVAVDLSRTMIEI
jgi:hypothetical protein